MKHELLEAKGIDLKNKKHGSIKTTCPECSQSRRDKNDPCLSVNIDDGVWNCHHCDFKGGVFDKPKKEYIKPLPRLEKLSTGAITWFDGRGISNNTLLRLGVTEAREWMPSMQKEMTCICFNYIREGELVNIKYRDGKKGFKMAKDAELIFYNLDAIKDETECVIVEGEIDCLTLHECGIHNVVSVPNGASKGSQKLEYLDNCWKHFENKTKIVLMVDGDEPGYALREELSRRLGKDRCYTVKYPEGSKDINDVFINSGKEEVLNTLFTATQIPIEGILTMDEMYGDVLHYYNNGYPTGVRVGIYSIDELVSFMGGQMTVITGIPGSGKSEVVDLIMTKTAINNEWSWGVCSFENQPSAFHVTKLVEKFIGKSFAKRNNPSSRVSAREFEQGVGLVDQHFHFINISQVDVTLKGILDKTAELVVRKGIKGLVIDPWNYIEHKIPKGYTETQYISESLSEVKAFALKYGIHVIIIAHPTKLQKDKSTGKYEVPTLYNISGSAHFFNKTDNGISVYRDFQTNQVDIYVQKVRYSWLGKIGFASFTYDVETRQYAEVNPVQKLSYNPDRFISSAKEEPFL